MRVCVVGAGAVGLSCARWLLQRGVEDVTILEADHVASGSSGLSVGIVETQYIDPLDIELRVRAIQWFNQLDRENKLGVLRNGYLRLARTDAALEDAERSVEIQHELGVADACVLDAAQIKERIPQMRTDDIRGGLFGPSDGFIDGHLYCMTLADMVVEAGAELRVRDGVTEIELGTGDDPIRVRTAGGREVECDFLVNAAGVWSPKVAALAGLEVPIVPQRHQAAIVDVGAELDYVMPSVMDYVPHSGDSGLYFRHERDGAMVAGLHTEDITAGVVDPDNYGRSADNEFLEELAAKLTYRLPSLSEAGLGGGWAGLYPISPDGYPQVGPMPGAARFIAAGGVGGSGIQLSPVVGELVSEWIVDGEVSAVSGAERLRPERPSLQTTGEHA